ncbi:TPA: hypothetical protein F7Z80_04130 [Legionella pneumophila]|nr:hypothetical protein AXF35_10915 [Legionella pneumophila subsp. pascullei]HAT6916138.1 hypothetical protein [Legionella pneumophila]AMP92162.1 hypothetical protein AXF36_05885 [Legionella pneumophila subsp. pascullei]AMP95128.1 hypothetical protein AXF37_05775 [Legionella pneumophila subsp. pascullei]HAT6918719.1 hypothetical protein [Legionella pneumophila]
MLMAHPATIYDRLIFIGAVSAYFHTEMGWLVVYFKHQRIIRINLFRRLEIMGTFFEWFPREVGLDKNPDAFRTDCYKYYWGDPPRWGGTVDACEVETDLYTMVYHSIGLLSYLIPLVGGYLALHFARNANSKTFSEENPEHSLEQSVLTLK